MFKSTMNLGCVTLSLLGCNFFSLAYSYVTTCYYILSDLDYILLILTLSSIWIWGTKVYSYIVNRIGLVSIIYPFGFQSNPVSYFILAYFFIITFHFWSSPPIQDRWATHLGYLVKSFCILMFLLSLVITFLLKLSLDSFIFHH